MTPLCSSCLTAVEQGTQSVVSVGVYRCDACCGKPACETHTVIDEGRAYCTDCLNFWEEVAAKLMPEGALVPAE